MAEPKSPPSLADPARPSSSSAAPRGPSVEKFGIFSITETAINPLRTKPEEIGTWRSRTLRSVPWAGLGALVIVLGITAAVACLLASADGQETARWPVKERPTQLTVVLAILVALGNAALALAHMHGVAVSWWLRMLRGGKLAESHRLWEHGTSALKPLLEPHRVSKVSLSSIMLVASFLVGPLLQRAVTIVPARAVSEAVVGINLARDELHQPTGFYMTRAPAVSILSPNFSLVVREYTARRPIRLDLEGCTADTTCNTSVVAPGFDVRCEKTPVPYDLSFDKFGPGNTTTVGAINVTDGGTWVPHAVNVTTLFKSLPEGKGDLTQHHCALQLAQVTYRMEVNNGSAKLAPIELGVNRTVALHNLPMEAAGLGVWPSQLGGLFLAIRDMYESKIDLYQTGIMAIQDKGMMQNTYMSSSSSALGTVTMTWSDPMLDVLNSLQELTFRAALAMPDNGGAHRQDASVLRSQNINRYRIRWAFVAGALVIVLLAVMAVAWLFTGFWLLGRRVSMSPLELATAFQAPITAGAVSNAEVSTLVKQCGHRRVKYGVIRDQDDGQVRPGIRRTESLAIAPHTTVSLPVKGCRYD